MAKVFIGTCSYTPKKAYATILRILFLFLSAITLLISWVVYAGSFYIQDLINNGFEVEAEYVAVRSETHNEKESRKTYSMIYLYVDDTGQEYRGGTGPYFSTESEAEAYIGQKTILTITKDGKHYPGRKENLRTPFVPTLILGCLFIPITIFAAWLLIYCNIYIQKRDQKIYISGETVTGVIRGYSKRWPRRVKIEYTDKNGKEHTVWSPQTFSKEEFRQLKWKKRINIKYIKKKYVINETI